MDTQPRDLAEYQTDHDLIVGLVRDVKHFGDDIRELKDAVSKKNDDHEARIRTNEKAIVDLLSSSRTWRYVVSIALTALGIGVTIIGAYISRI